jgi:hypothetical protein
VGRDGLRRARVSDFGANETKRGEIEVSSPFIWFPACAGGLQCRQRLRDVAHLVAVSTYCASRGGDENEDSLLVFIQAKGYMPVCWAVVWAAEQAATGML